MRIPFSRPMVQCPNCQYQGPGKVKSEVLHSFGALVAFFLGLVFWPLLLVAIAWVVVVIVKPARIVCPDCNYQHTVMLKAYLARNGN